MTRSGANLTQRLKTRTNMHIREPRESPRASSEPRAE